MYVLYLYCNFVPSRFPGGSGGKNLLAMQETGIQSLGWEDPLEKEMTTHSSILAWEIPWTEEPGVLQSMGCKESDTTARLTLYFPLLNIIVVIILFTEFYT